MMSCKGLAQDQMGLYKQGFQLLLLDERLSTSIQKYFEKTDNFQFHIVKS